MPALVSPPRISCSNGVPAFPPPGRSGGLADRRPAQRSCVHGRTNLVKAEGALLDAHQVMVFARLIVLWTTQDQLRQRDAWRLDDMEMVILRLGTGGDHVTRAPINVPHDGRRADAGHLEGDGKQVAVRRLL